MEPRGLLGGLRKYQHPNHSLRLCRVWRISVYSLPISRSSFCRVCDLSTSAYTVSFFYLRVWVSMLMAINPSAKDFKIHFRDVRRWANINHLYGRVVKAQQVINTVLRHHLLTSAEYEVLLRLNFDSPLPGFRPGLSVPTISSLHELLDENWLD